MCTRGDTARIDMISKFLPHMCQHVDVCVAVKISIKIGPLVLLLYMFVITENIMKCPVLPTSQQD